MAKETTEKNGYNIHEEAEDGEIRIADEVVAIIAGIAAMEVQGVASLGGSWTRELIARLGRKDLSKGVRVEITEDGVLADLTVHVKYGFSIPDVSRQVQDKVTSAIENMTGLSVLEVNIRIAGVQLDNQR